VICCSLKVEGGKFNPACNMKLGIISDTHEFIILPKTIESGKQLNYFFH
jgi:hypothetical protein